MHLKLLLAPALFSLMISSASSADEAAPAAILADLLARKQAILASAGPTAPAQTLFLAFWDFDGTILKGDCSEGLMDGDKPVYPGLAERLIESGHSRIYPPGTGVQAFWSDYRHMEETIGPWLAYPYIPQMLRGANAEAVATLSREHFEAVLRRYYFAGSIELLNSLERNGVENHVISASADLFVDAAAPTLGLPPDRLNGITLRIRDGVLTEELVYPVTLAEGKTARLLEIVAKTRLRHPGAPIVVLAGFGNSYRTDGPFLKHIATQSLSSASPVSVMINGGDEPAAYQGLFKRITLTETLSSSARPAPPAK